MSAMVMVVLIRLPLARSLGSGLIGFLSATYDINVVMWSVQNTDSGHPQLAWGLCASQKIVP